MEWLGQVWKKAKENGTWVGIGVLAVVGGGAAVYYINTTREQAIRQEQRTLQLQLEGAEPPQAAEEEAVAAAPVNHVQPTPRPGQGGTPPARPTTPAGAADPDAEVVRPAATGAGEATPAETTGLVFMVFLFVLVLVATVLRMVLEVQPVHDGGLTDTLLSPNTTGVASLILVAMAAMTTQASSTSPLLPQGSKAPAPMPAKPTPHEPDMPPVVNPGEPGFQPGEELDGADPDTASAAAAATGAGEGSPAEAEAAAAESAAANPAAAADDLHAKFQLEAEGAELTAALDRAVKAGDRAGEAALQWRVGRWANATSWRMAMAAGGPEAEGEADRAKRLGILQRGWGALQRSLALQEASPDAHKWAAVVLAQVSPTTAERIKNAFVIRDHGRRAVELDGADPQARYILGAWAYTVAGVGWFERQAARAVFGSAPPEATYEEALEHFTKAEATAPGFWMVNRLKIAQTQLALGNKMAAKQWLGKCLDMQHTPDEDRYGASDRQKLRATLGM